MRAPCIASRTRPTRGEHAPSLSSPFHTPTRNTRNTRADTKRVRDACVVGKGEEKCGAEIEAHKVCLRADGFTVA